jgi:hypothetical protein
MELIQQENFLKDHVLLYFESQGTGPSQEGSPDQL